MVTYHNVRKFFKHSRFFFSEHQNVRKITQYQNVRKRVPKSQKISVMSTTQNIYENFRIFKIRKIHRNQRVRFHKAPKFHLLQYTVVLYTRLLSFIVVPIFFWYFGTRLEYSKIFLIFCYVTRVPNKYSACRKLKMNINRTICHKIHLMWINMNFMTDYPIYTKITYTVWYYCV